MLILYLLSITLFIIILLDNSHIIEGQNNNNNNTQNNNNNTQNNNNNTQNNNNDNTQNNNNNKTDYGEYSYNNFIADYDTILNKINFSEYLGINIKNFMEKYNSKCSDNDGDLSISDDINKELINNNNKDTDKNKDENKSILNVNKMNNLLGYFNIKIKNNNKNIYEDDNEEEDDDKKQLNVCSLVNNIYDNNISGSLVKKITDNYGNCFVPKDENNIFQNSCKNSCHLQEEQLEICNEFSIDGINNCADYSKVEGNTLNDIHVQNNGLYYNCSLVKKKVGEYTGKMSYNEIPCIPKNNICNSKHAGFQIKCNDYDKSMGGVCEDYYMFENGTYYNCISDDKKYDEEKEIYSCVKDIKDKYTKPCIKEELVTYNECDQVYN